MAFRWLSFTRHTLLSNERAKLFGAIRFRPILGYFRFSIASHVLLTFHAYFAKNETNLRLKLVIYVESFGNIFRV